MLDIPNVVAFLIKRFVIQYEFPSFVQTYHRSMLSTYFLGLNSSAQFILLFLFGAILNFMYLFSFGCCFKGFSLLLQMGGYSPVAMHQLLIAVASLVQEHWIQSVWASVAEAHGLSSCSSQALEHRLNSCDARA